MTDTHEFVTARTTSTRSPNRGSAQRLIQTLNAMVATIAVTTTAAIAVR